MARFPGEGGLETGPAVQFGWPPQTRQAPLRRHLHPVWRRTQKGTFAVYHQPTVTVRCVECPTDSATREPRPLDEGLTGFDQRAHRVQVGGTKAFARFEVSIFDELIPTDGKPAVWMARTVDAPELLQS